MGLRAIAAIVYIEADLKDDTKYKVSLRSAPEEDTSVISKTFGGGGHKNASSFMYDKHEFDSEWRISK